MKKVLLFLIPFLITLVVVVGYFKVTQKLSSIDIPSLPSVSFSDLVKLSRFSLEKAPSASLVGAITSMEGEVMHEERLATESAKISTPIPIQQGESLSTGVDGKVILTFEKATELTISSETKVGIIQTLPADLVFSQNTGSVEYIKLANIPVSVRSYHLLIKNDGDVTVSVDTDSPKPIVTVVVNSGSATVAFNNKENISQVLTVEEGHTLSFNDGTRRVIILN
jgi:hypothetical protein